MKAFCVQTDTQIAPFGGSVGQVTVAGKPLVDVQREALDAAGFELVSSPPASEPYLLFSDRTWFTSALLERIKRAGQGRLRINDPDWMAWSGPLNSWDEPGVYELAVRVGEPSFEGLSHLNLDVEFRAMDLNVAHSSFEHANQNPVVSSAMALQLEHWSHLVRVNQLVLAARMEAAREDWEQAGLLGKLWRVLKVIFRARSTDGWKIASALTERGQKVSIHPTAVVEFSVLHDGCEIGPHAVVRGSIVGAGAVIDSHAVVNASVLGAGSRVGRFGHVNLCTLFPKAMVSSGDGFQMCVFGEESFVAWGATVLDLSFGQTIKVEQGGPGSAILDSEAYFLGAAIGHRARIGHGVKIGYGVAIPEDALLVDDTDFLRRWGEGPMGEPAIVRDGEAVAKKS